MMKIPDEAINTAEFRRDIDRLKQTKVSFPEEIIAGNRLANLNALMSGWDFPGVQSPVSEICAGRAPQTISRPQMTVINIIGAYDFMVQDSKTSQSWDYPDSELLFKLALMIDPDRIEFGFETENMLRSQCRWVTRNWQGYSHGWNSVLFYIEWKLCPIKFPQISYTIGIATILCIIAKCFRSAPVLHGNDFSAVIKNIYILIDDQYTDTLAKFLHSNVYSAKSKVYSLEQQKQRETETAATFRIEQQKSDAALMPLIPMLKLLADGNARPGKVIMAGLGINQRLLFTNTFLKPAIEKQLVEATESNPNSPKQQYRLSDNGRQQLETFKGDIA